MSEGALSGTEAFEGRALHFIAIGGAGMSGLALVAHGLGARVTGSDRSDSTYMERLRRAGLDPVVGHAAEQVPNDADVVVSTAIGDDNPELVVARGRGQRVIHRGELLAELTAAAGGLIAVAGAHGKTTTSGMIAHALRAAGSDAAFILGGELPGGAADGGPVNASWGEAGVVVAEADESDGSFLRLAPDVALVTNVELDHHSHWGGEAELWRAFGDFCGKARAVVAAAGDAERLGADFGFAVADEAGGPAPVATTDFLAERVEPKSGGSSFSLRTPSGSVDVRLAVPGRHNVANATAALAALHAAGAGEKLPPLEALAAALETFRGMGRRLELKGTCNGAWVYDDYAHHPTEVAASLAALRELPHERLFVVFQPHLYSRTKALAGRFGRALAAADVIGVRDVYAAREEPVGQLEGVSGLHVVRATADAAPGRRVLWLDRLDRAAAIMRPQLREGDILATIGAGDVFKVGEELVAG